MSRAPKNDNNSTPTLNAIESWEEECVQIDTAVKGLLQRKSAIQSLISGAKRLLPAAASPAVKTPAKRRISKTKQGRKKRKYVRKAAQPPELPKPLRAEPAISAPKVLRSHKDGVTWTSTIKAILDQAGRGLTHQELRGEVLKTPLGGKLETSDKSYYGAVAKLSDAKHLVRHNGRLYAPPALQQFLKDVAAGKAIDKPVPLAGQRSPMGEAVKEFLKVRLEFGAVSGEIVRELSKNPDFEFAMQKNKTHIYNVLARLVSRREVFKKGERYLLARGNQEAA